MVCCVDIHVSGLLVYLTMEHTNNSSNSVLKTSQPMLLRSLFIIGLLCEHFECEEFDKDVVRREVFLFILHQLIICSVIYLEFTPVLSILYCYLTY